MAYTAYRTWTTGEIVTAALMNEQVKDNGLLTAPAIMTTAGDIIYASAANTPARLAKSTTSTQYLANTGTSNVPQWNEVALTTGVSGTLPVGNGGTGITSLGSNVATFLGTPSSTNLRSALTDETGTGAAVFGTSPTLATPALGTPTALVLTSATGLPVGGLANGTDGELITWNASGVAAAVAVGTAKHVLTSNGVGAAPTFQASGSAVESFRMSTAFETAGRFVLTTVSGGLSTFNTAQGVSLDTSSTSTSSQNLQMKAHNILDTKLFLGSPKWSTSVRIGVSASCTAFAGIGTVAVNGSGHTFTDNHIGFKTVGTAIHVTQADGSTENASASLATISSDDVYDMAFEVDGTSSTNYYTRLDGGALSSATNLTSNMPSTNVNILQQSVSNNGTGNRLYWNVAAMSYTR